MVVIKNNCGEYKPHKYFFEINSQDLTQNLSKINPETLFDFCLDCKLNIENMSSIPQGVYYAKKVRENEEKLFIARMSSGEGSNSQKYYNTKLMELAPLKYNSKLMNSIWGMYNKYSPHNFKKTNDEAFKSIGDLQGSANLLKIDVLKEVAVGKIQNKQQYKNVTNIENMWAKMSLPQSH